MEIEQSKLMSPVDAINRGLLEVTDNLVGSKQIGNQIELEANDFNLATAMNSLLNLDGFGLSDRNHSLESKYQRQGLRLNHYNFMVHFADGNQICDVPSIYPLPNSPEWFLGMCNLNGQTIPVFNLKKYFHIENQNEALVSSQKKPMLFVIQQGDNATGVIIDGLLERLVVADNKLQNNMQLPEHLKAFVNATYLLENEVWYDLNCLSFLDVLESKITC